LNYKPNPRKHVKEYLKLQGRFSHLDPEDFDKIDKMVEEEWPYWEESNKRGKIVLPYEK
jgi:pyruvate/2-oxoacid:ferredoxin oxidoreductase beta subunit